MFAVYSFGRGSRRGREEVDGDPAAAPALANAITMPTHARPPQAGAGLLTPQPRQRRWCRPACGWNLRGAISGNLKLSDQAARSIG